MFRKITSLLTGAALALLLCVSIAPPAEAGASSAYLIGKLYGNVFQNAAYTPPATVYVALGTGSFSAQSCTSEVTTSGTNNARVAVTANTSNWVTNNPSGSISNGSAIVFASGGVTGSWGTVNQFCIYDASTGGNLLISAQLTTSQAINNGQAGPTFAIGALTWTIN